MELPSAFYPVQIVSRTVIRKRSRRLALLILGGTLGLALLAQINPKEAPAPAEEVASPAPPSVVPPGKPLPAISVTADDAPAVTRAASARTYPLALELSVERGDTLINLLTDAGVSYEEAQNAVESVRAVYDPRKLDIGQNVSVVLDKHPNASNPIIARLRLSVSPTASLELTRSDPDNFHVQKVDAPVDKGIAHAGGRIDSSFYETAEAAGLPPALVQEIIHAYSYDVDFQRDIQPGDAIDVLYERMQTRDGKTAGHGDVLYAELNLSGRHLKLYRYADRDGHADYYNERGESVRKAMLRTPINGAHITSRFGMRTHPILGYSRMHRGVDFGAPTGTPIYAAGDGTVEMAGRKGGYGNYLRLRHNSLYESAYGHISRFAAGIHAGSRVHQGQVIAYVGATGLATGPHLHYEILFKGQQVNPAGVKFKSGNVLGGRELAAFRKSVARVETALNTIPRGKTDLAMADAENQQGSSN